MILVDFSSILYQSLYGAIKAVNPQKDNILEKYITSDFSRVMIDYILENIFKFQNEYRGYGQLVLCVDDHYNANWRKQYLSTYKFNRKSDRDHSEIDFNEVFKITNELLDVLDKYTPFKVVKADHAEGDDIILILAKNYHENTIIVSTDKDMIQAKLYNDKIVQISPLTLKTVSFEDKNTHSLEEWLQVHVCLGDDADNIPRIIHNIKFSENFKNYLTENNIKITELEFNSSQDLRESVLKHYHINRTDGKGNVAELDVFEKPRFGRSGLSKKIKEYGSLTNWINSDQNLKNNFELNKKLILADYIPSNIVDQTLNNFKTADNTYKQKEFEKYLYDKNLSQLVLTLPFNFVNTFNVQDW